MVWALAAGAPVAIASHPRAPRRAAFLGRPPNHSNASRFNPLASIRFSFRNRCSYHCTRAATSVTSSSGAASDESLPPHFDFQLALLLGGFAFECYNEPVGGVRSSDAKGTEIAYLSPFVQEHYAGVLEVKLHRAKGLRKADLIGQSDPYAIIRVGDNAYRTKTVFLTLNPRWNETCRLYVRSPAEQSLEVQLYDADLIGSDDDLGVALAPLDAICAAAQATELQLPVRDLGGGGGGGGEVHLAAQFFPFKAAGRAPPPESPQSLSLGAITGFALGAIRRAISQRQMEQLRRQWEQELWVVSPDADWTVLASMNPRHAVPLPSRFEKVAYVESSVTDTQACVWRSEESRVVVLAFRGTEQTKWKDIATDANLIPAGYDVESGAGGGFWQGLAGGGGAEEVKVHSGFLRAFTSVRAPLLSLVDMCTSGDPADPPWHVFVTGHSLGGALSTLMADTLADSVHRGRRSLQVTMYNFGSPRVGNAAYVERYNELVPDSFRVVNSVDAVPRVPLTPYRHVQHPIFIDESGRLNGDGIAEVDPAPAELAAMLGCETAAEDAMEALAVLPMGGEAVNAHMEECYYAALRVCADKLGVSTLEDASDDSDDE